MPFTTNFSKEVLELIFENSNIPNLGDSTGVRGSSDAGSFELALIKSGGAEADYTGYQRLLLTRTSNVWSTSGATLSNALEITFPPCVGNAQTIIGFKILYGAVGTTPYSTELGSGTLNNTVPISAGETPRFEALALTITLS